MGSNVGSEAGHIYGSVISWDRSPFLCNNWSFHSPLRAINGEQVVNGIYFLAGLLALALLVYLFLALLKPEWFE